MFLQTLQILIFQILLHKIHLRKIRLSKLYLILAMSISVSFWISVFSFEKIRGADISLGPEMKSTGECLGIAKTFDEALYKAFIGAAVKLPKHKNMIMTVRDEDKEEAVEIGRRFEKIGYKIFATEGTAKVLTDAGVKAMTVNKIEQESPNLMDLILGHKIDLVIDTPPQGADH